jgi:hypothetical protein
MSNQYGYPTNAPPPPRKSGGCLPWAIGGCVALAVLAVVGVIIAANYFKNDPRVRKMVKEATASPAYGQRLITIKDALEKYRQAHGEKYPTALNDLVPEYLPDRSALEETIGTGAEARKLIYTPPKPDAPDSAPVVSFEGQETEFFAGASQVQNVRLLKNGRVVIDQVTRRELTEKELNRPYP